MGGVWSEVLLGRVAWVSMQWGGRRLAGPGEREGGEWGKDVNTKCKFIVLE
jgi:hypothetical protein